MAVGSYKKNDYVERTIMLKQPALLLLLLYLVTMFRYPPLVGEPLSQLCFPCSLKIHVYGQ